MQSPPLLTRPICLLIGVLLSCQSVHGDDDLPYWADSVRWSWTPELWVGRENYVGIRGNSPRPDDDALEAVRVEWVQPTLDALGNLCVVSGRLVVETSEDQVKHVDWFQGITCYLAKAPDAAPDWTKGMSQSNTLSETSLIDHDGRFAVRIDLRESQYDRDKKETFQFGLSLARHEVQPSGGQQVVWRSDIPALQDSVQMLTIPAAAELPVELELINQANQWPFVDPNGTKLIRVVNALQKLGKEESLATLTRYLQLVSESEFAYSDEGDIVFWIVRLLFLPTDPDVHIPLPAIAVAIVGSDESGRDVWPLNPMAEVEDVPFMVGQRIGGSGIPEAPISHVEWARDHGRIRAEPLRPGINPLVAAKQILDKPELTTSTSSWRAETARHIMSQAVAMTEGLVDPVEFDYRNPDNELANWKVRVDESVSRGIHWDAAAQRFRPRDQ
jgi:hypothetical protein